MISVTREQFESLDSELIPVMDEIALLVWATRNVRMMGVNVLPSRPSTSWCQSSIRSLGMPMSSRCSKDASESFPPEHATIILVKLNGSNGSSMVLAQAASSAVTSARGKSFMFDMGYPICFARCHTGCFPSLQCTESGRVVTSFTARAVPSLYQASRRDTLPAFALHQVHPTLQLLQPLHWREDRLTTSFPSISALRSQPGMAPGC